MGNKVKIMVEMVLDLGDDSINGDNDSTAVANALDTVLLNRNIRLIDDYGRKSTFRVDTLEIVDY